MKAAAETATPVYFQYRIPAEPLSHLVEVLWYWSGYERPRARERLLPMATVELVVQLQSPRASDSGIAGPRSEPLIIERHSTDEFLGVHFKSGGAFPFVRCAFEELHNTGVTLVELWGEKRGRRLLELLNEAETVELKFQILERWLMWIADRPLRHHAAVSLALRQFERDPGLFTSAIVAEQANLSQRHFIEVFRDEVGMTPKLFCRVQRFRSVIRAMQRQSEIDWVDVALSHGYSDQSHFNHDFRAFSGLTPSEYLGLRTEHLSHVRVPD
jgi:AraC-like DNA-binding protein